LAAAVAALPTPPQIPAAECAASVGGSWGGWGGAAQTAAVPAPFISASARSIILPEDDDTSASRDEELLGSGGRVR
jgi:hypothetical protein